MFFWDFPGGMPSILICSVLFAYDQFPVQIQFPHCSGMHTRSSRSYGAASSKRNF